IIHLAREGGLRLREAILADLPRLQREAAQHGSINIADGTKGGRRGAAAPRWIPVSEGLRQALLQAASVATKGSRNLLEPGERYACRAQLNDTAASESQVATRVAAEAPPHRAG